MRLASGPPSGMPGSGGLGMRSSRSSRRAVSVRQARVQPADLGADPGRLVAQAGHLRAVRRGAGLDGLADRVREDLALVAQGVALAEQVPTFRVHDEGLIDESGVLALERCSHGG